MLHAAARPGWCWALIQRHLSVAATQALARELAELGDIGDHEAWIIAMRDAVLDETGDSARGDRFVGAGLFRIKREPNGAPLQELEYQTCRRTIPRR